MPAPDCVAFYLPGLAHQLGNLLLTVQGNVLHLQPDDLERAQRSLLEAVERGGASLAILRAWTGEDGSPPQEASPLLARLVELARVPARELGLTISLRDEQPSSCWVSTDSFVRLCSEAIWRVASHIPAGTEGVIGISAQPADGGGVAVQLVFDLSDGSLPFPLAFAEVADELGPSLRDQACRVVISSTSDSVTLAFAAPQPDAPQQA
ncbi:MAG: hypothetical protein ACON4Z_03680 [Planctomycetota bacterium]